MDGRLFGYARISTSQQSLDLQVQALGASYDLLFQDGTNARLGDWVVHQPL